MAQYPTAEQVMDALGDKVVQGISESVMAAAADLVEYRRLVPRLAGRHSNRGLANWVHDQAWAHVSDRLDGVSNVFLVDSGPTREVQVGAAAQYRIRLKKHSRRGRVTGYPTTSMLEFICQDQPTLLSLVGITQVNLCVGYEWDSLTRDIVGPVMSLRDGSFADVVWMTDLPIVGSVAGASVAPMVAPQDRPALPAIDTPKLDIGTSEGSDLE